MAATKHRLAGAVEKFNRAKELFDDLRAEMGAFFNGDPTPYGSIGEFDTDAWEWVERFQVHEEPPLRLGVMLGDCVHNLRSCLDHIVWQVTLLDGATPDRHTQYPIVSKSEAQFERTADRCISGLSDRHRDMIRQTQPYRLGADASSHPLSMLADLSNTDKHRVVHAAFTMVGYDAARTLDGLIRRDDEAGRSPVEAWWLASEGRLEHGTPWFRVVWRRDEEPPVSVKLAGNLTTQVAFGDLGLPAAEFLKMAATVRKILDAFLAEFPETQYVD